MPTAHRNLTPDELHPLPRYTFASLATANAYGYSDNDESCLIRVGAEPYTYYLITRVVAGVATLAPVNDLHAVRVVDAAPSAGQVLTATGAATAEWADPVAELHDVVVSATPPTTGQILAATSPTTADWQTFDLSSLDTRVDDLEADLGHGTFQLWNSAKRTGVQNAKSDLFPGSSLDAKWLDFDPGASCDAGVVANNRLRLTKSTLLSGIAGKYQAVPAVADYSISCRVRVFGLANNTYNVWQAGLFLAENLTSAPTTADLKTIGISTVSSAHYQGVSYSTWTDYDSVTQTAFAACGVRGSMLVRIRVTGSTTATWEYSTDEGQSWAIVGGPVTTTFTPVHMGLFCVNNSGVDMYFDFSEFLVVEAANAVTDTVGGLETLWKAAP